MFSAPIAHAATFAVLDPRGNVAFQEKNLILTILGILLSVAIPVVITFFVFAFKYRVKEGDERRDESEVKRGPMHEIIWWVVPTIVIAVLGSITWVTAHKLDPSRQVTVDSNAKPFIVQVVALDWKWLFIYPEQNIATVNVLEVPAGVPLEFQLTAGDAPMNSFWLPQLGGQLYAMPGMVNKLHLVADAPGAFEGSAAEINGQGFAGMRFTTTAATQADFDAWAVSVKRAAKPLTKDEYNRLSAPSEDEPPAYYSSVAPGLYDTIVGKYAIQVATTTTAPSGMIMR